MKTRIFPVLALALTLSSALTAQDYVPEFETLQLPNGLQVTLHRDSTVSFVTLNMSYRAGSSRDPKGKTGVANTAGEALLTGTALYPREELLRLRTEEDVSIRAQTTVDWCSIASVFPADQLGQALAIEADRMRSAPGTATVEVFDAIVTVLKREHERRARKPLATLMQQIYDELYTDGHPYRHATLGYPSDLKDSAEGIFYHPVWSLLREERAAMRSNASWRWMEFLPRFNATWFRQDFADIGQHWGAELTASLPLWFLFDTRGSIEEHRAASRMAEEDYTIAVMQFEKRSALSFGRLQAAGENYLTYEEDLLREASTISSTAKLGYMSGEINYMEYLAAQQTVNEIRLGFFDALVELYGAIAEYELYTNTRILE